MPSPRPELLPKLHIIRLVSEELKNSYFFSALRTLGLDDTFYQSDLSSVIMASIGFGDDSTKAVDIYFALLEKYAQHVQPNNEAIVKLGTTFYQELMKELETLK
jgi:hypothetical protein